MSKTGCWRQLSLNMQIAKRTSIRFAHLRIFILLRKGPRFLCDFICVCVCVCVYVCACVRVFLYEQGDIYF